MVAKAVVPNFTVAPFTNCWPVIVSGVFGLPLGTLAGESAVRTGTGLRTVKLAADWAVPAESVTAIFPVVAPLGTTAVRVVALLIVKIAALPLNVTDCTLIKLVPVSVTVVPTVPLVGVKLVMVGA